MSRYIGRTLVEEGSGILDRSTSEEVLEAGSNSVGKAYTFRSEEVTDRWIEKTFKSS